MKEISEYNNHDCELAKEYAKKMAIATIHKIYKENHHDEKLTYEDLHSVKKALQIIVMLH